MFKSLQDDFVGGFCLPFLLWVLNKHKFLLCVEHSDGVLELLVGKLCPIVSDKCLQYAEPGEHVSFVETKNVVQRDFGESFNFYPLGEIIDDDN